MQPDAPVFDSEVIDLFTRLSEALVVGKLTAPVVSLLLMVTVAVMRRMPAIAAKMPNHWVPAYAVGLGLVEALGQGMLSGWPWTAIVSRGFITGVMAIGMWEAGGKQVLKPFFTKIHEAGARTWKWLCALAHRIWNGVWS